MSCVDMLTMQFGQRTPEHDRAPAGPGKILEKISGIGHCVATMRPYPNPCRYRPEDLAKIVSDYSVFYRGYTYPHLGSGRYGSARTTDKYAEACHDAFGNMSIWRFYRNGQFKVYMGLMEDIVDNAHGAPPPPLQGAELRRRYLEPVWALFDMSEAFVFASNLASNADSRYAVSMAFEGMGGRVLDMRTPGRIGFSREYASSEDRIELEPTAVAPHLDTGTCGSIALEKTLELLGRFGWASRGSREALAYDQEMFFAKSWKA